MSEEAAREFISKLKADPELRKQLSAEAGQGAMASALGFAAKNGHAFSHEDLVNAYAADLKARGYSQADIDDLKSSASDPAKYSSAPAQYHSDVVAPY